MRPTSDLGTYRLKVRGWKKIFHANGNQKKAGVAILVSNKIHFKIKTITRDKGHYKMIKISIQEDKTIVNIYAPNRGVPQYIRQMLKAIKGEIDSNTIIVGGFNTSLSQMDSSSKMKIRASLVAQWLRICRQCRGHGFEPWSGKIPHAAEQLGP